MADYDRYGRDDRDRYRGNRDRDNQGAGYAGRSWAERAGDEVASWTGDRDAEYRRERDRNRLGRYPGEDAGERRYGADDRYGNTGRDRNAGYGNRSWAERAGDEVSSWAGDRDAEYRRERDRDRLGRYPGEEAGERRYGEGSYGERYESDRDGYRERADQRGYGGGYGGQTAYGSYGGGSGQTAYGSSGREGMTGSYDRQSRGGLFGGGYGQQSGGGYSAGSYGSPSDSGGMTGQGGYSRTGYGQQQYQGGARTDYSGNEASRSYGTGYEDPNRTYAQGFGQDRYGSQSSGLGAADMGSGADYNPSERGFFTRAADEVASWFGDEDAERRRQLDQMREDSQQAFSGDDERNRSSARAGDVPFSSATGFSSQTSRYANDPYYSSYRAQRAEELDRDFSSFAEERRGRFNEDFSSWRASRQGSQAASTGTGASATSSTVTGNALAGQVREHAQVVGSDGTAVGMVDRVQGGDIKLAKKDSPDGQHHLIPLSWVASVEGDTVRLNKSAADAKAEWRSDTGAAGAGADSRAGGGTTIGTASAV